MALSYLFYPSQNNDRKYSVGDFKSYFSEIINEGVIPKTDSALKVIPSQNMTVKIQNGTVFGNDGSMARVFGDGENVIIANADGTNTRIDYIVMRNSVSDRKFIPVYIKGEPSSSPSSPEILRDGDNYDYLLAKITVQRGTTEITQEMITDERYGEFGSMGGAFTSDQLNFDLKVNKSEVKHFAYDFGDIKLTACTNPPQYWLLCNGQVISREEYSDLFKAIGETYGKGDGVSTFNLPDLSGRTAIGVNSAHVLGSKGGSEYHTLSVSEMPAHSHITSITNGKTTSGTEYDYISSNAENIGGPINKRRGYMLSEISGIANVTGSSQAHNNMQPFLSLNYIIFTGV